MDYNYELVDALGKEINKALKENNKPLVDAINNLAMNTGNKTTREYNELKKKYTELENKCEKSNSLLKSIITMYTLVVFNYNRLGEPLNPDKVVEIMDQSYKDIQEHQYGLIPDVLIDNIINTANEVYEKLIGR